MSQDSKALSCAFLGIGLILLAISAIIFHYHFTFTKSAVHIEGTIVDAIWYNNHSDNVDGNGSWYPVVIFHPTPDYTLIFGSNIGSDLYEGSEGGRVNVYYPPGHPEQAEVNNPWANFFRWGFVGIADITFGSIGLIITFPSTKESHRKRKSRLRKNSLYCSVH